MSEIEIRLRMAIKQAARKCFLDYTIHTSRGDGMCPHPVTYHPKDGHGAERETFWLSLDENGRASCDEDADYGDPLEALCQIFESLPEIKERDLIK